MKKAILLVGLMIAMTCLCAQTYIGDSIADFVTLTEPTYLIDDFGVLEYADVKGAVFSDSLEEALEAMLTLNTDRIIWARFDIQVREKPPEPLALRTYPYAHIRCYLVCNGKVDSVDVGLADIGYYRHQDSDPLAVLLDVDRPDTLTVVFRISHTMRSALIRNIGFEVEEVSVLNSEWEASEADSMMSSYFFIFFCGLLIFQAAYVLFQWSLVRRWEYVYYALYLSAVFIYYYGRFSVYFCAIPSFSFIDAGMMLVWNDVLLILPTFFYFRFARYFVDLEVYDPRLNMQMKRFEWLLLGVALLVLLLRLIPNDLSKALPVFGALAAQLIFSIYALVRISRQKRTIANFLVAGSLVALLSHVVANVMPFALPFMMEYVAPVTFTMYGVLAEIAIFNTGLLFKARNSEREKVKVQAAYIKELQSRERLQAEYAGVRDKIASDLHDDIGSSLSSINIYSYAADERLARGDIDKTKDLLKSIGRSAGDTLNSMSDLVWVINPANDSTDKLVARVKSFAYEILSACDCSFHMEVDPAFLAVQLNQEERKNVLLILKESINNAAKYSGATKVTCRIEAESEGVFVITLSDNGVGLPDTLVPGNGLRSMRARSMSLSGYFDVRSDGDGTTIAFKVLV